ASPIVASEFVGTSITSQAWPQERLAALLVDNPHMTFSDGRHRGYARFDLSRERLGADLRAMESVQKREAACNTLASFVVEDGKPGAVRTPAYAVALRSRSITASQPDCAGG